jgi:hypothetical protein
VHALALNDNPLICQVKNTFEIIRVRTTQGIVVLAETAPRACLLWENRIATQLLL